MSLSWGIVIVVTVISVVIAMYAARGKQGSGITSDEDFLVAGRDLGSFAAACTLVATYWSGYAFIGSVGVAWEFGYNSLVAGAAYVPPLVFAVIFLANYLKKKAYKMGSLSIPEYAGQIHNSAGVHALVAVLNVLLMTVMLIAQMKAMGLLMGPILGISENAAILILGGITIFYTMYGGLKAVAYSDVVMAVGMTVGALLCLIFVFKNTGLGEMTARLQAINPELVNPTTGAPYGSWKYGGVLIIPMALLGLVATPYTAVRFISVKKEIKWHEMALIACVIAVIWEMLPFVGTFIRAYGPTPNVPDSAMPVFLTSYMPVALSALLSVFILMAIRSTVDSVLQNVASSISYDLRKVLYKKPITNEQAVKLNRCLVGIVGVLAIVLNYFTKPTFLVFLGTLGVGTLEAASFGPILLSTFWQGNKYGAIASMLAGAAVCGYGLLTDTMMWTVAPLVGELVGGIVYVVVSKATFGICPRRINEALQDA